MVAQPKKFNVGVDVSLNVIAGKWKPAILCLIGAGTNRNGQLLQALPGLSQKVLTEQLKQLINDDILERQVFAETPPHVEYRFTEYGESLKTILMQLCHWGEVHANRCPDSIILNQPHLQPEKEA